MKLEEMEVKVDRELPDYIIVMISNRKTREEMWESLTPFVGATKASEFTKWSVFNLPRKYQVYESTIE